MKAKSDAYFSNQNSIQFLFYMYTTDYKKHFSNWKQHYLRLSIEVFSYTDHTVYNDFCKKYFGRIIEDRWTGIWTVSFRWLNITHIFQILENHHCIYYTIAPLSFFLQPLPMFINKLIRSPIISSELASKSYTWILWLLRYTSVSQLVHQIHGGKSTLLYLLILLRFFVFIGTHKVQKRAFPLRTYCWHR